MLNREATMKLLSFTRIFRSTSLSTYLVTTSIFSVLLVLVSMYMEKATSRVCERYNAAAKKEYPIIEGAWRKIEPLPHQSEVTLISQLKWTREKSKQLYYMVQQWEGPISIAILLPWPEELPQIVQELLEHPLLSNRKNVDLQFVRGDGEEEFYPINLMRNIGLHHARTDYVFIVDIDAIPNIGLYQSLKRHIISDDLNDRTAVAVPVFEFRTPEDIVPVPSHKHEVISLLMNNKSIPSLFTMYCPSHYVTNYTNWITADKPYYVAFQRHCEPYIMVKRSEIPDFKEYFVNGFYDRTSHVEELAAMGFRFQVIPDGWLFDHPHSRTPRSYFQMCADVQNGHFAQYLSGKYQFPSEFWFKVRDSVIYTLVNLNVMSPPCLTSWEAFLKTSTH